MAEPRPSLLTCNGLTVIFTPLPGLRPVPCFSSPGQKKSSEDILTTLEVLAIYRQGILVAVPQNVYGCLIIKNVSRNKLEQLVYTVVVTKQNPLISSPHDTQQFEQITSHSKAMYYFPTFQLQ